MKKIVCLLGIVLVSGGAFAAAPSTSYPSGYICLDASQATVAASSCPSNYVSVGSTTSCISGPGSNCIMYAPANQPYTDSNGTYEFTSICPMT